MIPIRGKIPITYLNFVYNEEDRIRYCLDSAIPWADEIVIIDNGSTDKTIEICKSYGVRVIEKEAKYPQFNDFVEAVTFPMNKWIYIGTGSEIPTKSLIDLINVTLEMNSNLDLIYVPRKYYSFGVHDNRSPWCISYFPFLINREKAIVSNVVHKNFTPSNPSNISHIQYEEDCCVYHLTHPTALKTLRDAVSYWSEDATYCTNYNEKINECLSNIKQFEYLSQIGDPDMFLHYLHWTLYWIGTALFVTEKFRERDVVKEYKEIADEVMEREWRTV